MQTWHLEDADKLAALHPRTFYKPPISVISRVRVGHSVKLIFAPDRDDPEGAVAERMWVVVDSVNPKGEFTGRLMNEPISIVDLRLKEPISFKACHIIATENDS